MKQIEFIERKILSSEQALQKIKLAQLKNAKVVFTNGCFDILHKGHVSYLAQASDLGQLLVVGLNTDASLKAQGKGDDRPINDENARAAVLASLHFVDIVVFFEEQTPIELIRLLKPDVLVKGADYDPEETNVSSKKYIVGSDIVRSYGGSVQVIDLVDGFSTTSILKKMKS